MIHSLSYWQSIHLLVITFVTTALAIHIIPYKTFFFKEKNLFSLSLDTVYKSIFNRNWEHVRGKKENIPAFVTTLHNFFNVY